MSTYKKGLLYLFNAPGDIVTWEAGNAVQQHNAELIVEASATPEQIEARTGFVSFGDPYVFVFSLEGGFAFSNTYKPDPNCIVFVLCDQSLQSDPERYDDRIKAQQSEHIKIVKYRQPNYLRRKPFKQWYESLSEQERAAVYPYRAHPWKLQALQRQGIEPLEQQEEATDYRELDNLLGVLGTARGLRIWKEIDRGTLFRIFLTPEPEKGGGYLALAGGRNPKRDTFNGTHLEGWEHRTPSLRAYDLDLFLRRGKAPELWHYYRRYAEPYLQESLPEPELFVYLFAVWVYVASNQLAGRRAKGFQQKTSKNGRLYNNFAPSQNAIRLFEQLLQE
ncbi:MAG: hypothetical protein ABEK59_07415 [Halobacteria archaeon]